MIDEQEESNDNAKKDHQKELDEANAKLNESQKAL